MTKFCALSNFKNHLLVAVTLTVESKLWTRDKLLEAAAARLGLSQNSP
jgi:hypothetical protein